jgi:hypothetical protein
MMKCKVMLCVQSENAVAIFHHVHTSCNFYTIPCTVGSLCSFVVGQTGRSVKVMSYACIVPRTKIRGALPALVQRRRGVVEKHLNFLIFCNF